MVFRRSSAAATISLPLSILLQPSFSFTFAGDLQPTSTSSIPVIDDTSIFVNFEVTDEPLVRRRETPNHDEIIEIKINGGHDLVTAPPRGENAMARGVPAMDAAVKMFCVHTKPNFSLPWQRKRQCSSSSSGFVI